LGGIPQISAKHIRVFVAFQIDLNVFHGFNLGGILLRVCLNLEGEN